jgi:hypothetical protein
VAFLDNRHIKVVRLSALRTGRLHPQEYPGTHFERLSRPRAHGLIGCLGKKSAVPRPGIDPGNFRLVLQRLNHYAKGTGGAELITDEFLSATVYSYRYTNLLSTHFDEFSPFHQFKVSIFRNEDELVPRRWQLQYFGMWRRVVWHRPEVSEEPAASIFRVGAGGTRFHRNVGRLLPCYMVSHPKIR